MHRLAIALLLAACVADDGSDSEDPAPIGDDGHVTISASVATPAEPEYDVCEHLPADPPCSLICDHDALDDYVPENVCAVFVCVLTDGNQVSVHACHPPS